MPKKKIVKPKKLSLDKLWQLAIISRDRRCVRCGSPNGLAGHHIVSRKHKMLRYFKGNGITLCFPCHMFFVHRDTARGAEMIKSKIGNKKYQELIRVPDLFLNKYYTKDIILKVEQYLNGHLQFNLYEFLNLVASNKQKGNIRPDGENQQTDKDIQK